MGSNFLSPVSAARLLGVGQSTVRRWCDNGLLRFSKTAGGHRRIDRRELLQFAHERGLEVVDDAAINLVGRSGKRLASSELSEQLYQRLIIGDEAEVQQFVVNMLAHGDRAADVCDEVIAPTMHRIGTEWADGHLRIFHEHAATQAMQTALALARSRQVPHRGNKPIAICAAPPDDPYALTVSMCALALADEGFHTILLGPDTPLDEILHAAVDMSALIIALSISRQPAVPVALAELCTDASRHRIRVAVGGRMLTPELRRMLQPDFFGDTMAHLASYGRRLREDHAGGDCAVLPYEVRQPIQPNTGANS